ncbi:thioesterase [Tamlana sp. 2_MG-2023]|uniref:acyl-[acyl-carrier-protein] thioesterase n=1 Tax=unclassified Tamlana TaxID=2614803 RepID=UPI0026E41893|nr:MULTISPECIES: acyl-ACP thioesterase domain-containing protein [unclassified Tamlana]MDO6760104.1 thioesterase [Tamlana sp. 2_MG-2023]MDO6790198.1 thioesterase [Tamlana sp. 1_MG-2023]
MKLNPSVFEQTYPIRSVNINSNKKLGLYGLLGLLQDITSEHAYDLNFGYENMIKRGFIWVLIRQNLKMKAWPNWHDTLTIKTWTLPVDGFYGTREFEIFLKDEKIGACSTIWMILDSVTRRPKKITDIETSFSPRSDYQLDFKANKIVTPGGLELNQNIQVKNSDLDMHNHVNNIKYSQWALDAIPFEYHKKYSITEFEINFLHETLLGDDIALYSSTDLNTKNEVFFSGKNLKTSQEAFKIKMKIQEGLL